KSNMTYDAWLAQTGQPPQYYTVNSVPTGIPYTFNNFLEFVDEREKLLKKAIVMAFPSDFAEIVSHFGLADKI
ncbi:MAG: hypothetical protein Q4E94_06795, partial [Clostridia bacterium]|nr:hypothetical protein [Clostridia bacterium]